jgi:hypothetical protein
MGCEFHRLTLKLPSSLPILDTIQKKNGVNVQLPGGRYEII